MRSDVALPPGYTDICLIEDDLVMGESVVNRFELEGLSIHWHQTAEDAGQALDRYDYGLVISDIRLPDMSGDRLFETLKERASSLPPFIFVTGYGDLERAVELLKAGAADYVTKPFNIELLLARVAELLPACAAVSVDSADVLGISPAMQEIEQIVQRVAPLDTPVLITGETGTGKEVVARRLHSLGRRGAFVAVNCASIPEGLAESELFGHERGAFTGASRRHRGVFERAHGGTLFLDEIGDMPSAMQARLLRVLQDGSFTRVGGEQPVKIDTRLLCATHKDPGTMSRDGSFRADLLYRINVVHMHVPPLRERAEDALWLSRLFLEQWACKQGRPRKHLAPEAEEALLLHDWPGNVRDLRHSIERACIFTDDSIISREALFPDKADMAPAKQIPDQGLKGYLQTCERRYIEHCLEIHDGRIQETANDLGISRKSLWEKMKRLEIRQQ